MTGLNLNLVEIFRFFLVLQIFISDLSKTSVG